MIVHRLSRLSIQTTRLSSWWYDHVEIKNYYNYNFSLCRWGDSFEYHYIGTTPTIKAVEHFFKFHHIAPRHWLHLKSVVQRKNEKKDIYRCNYSPRHTSVKLNCIKLYMENVCHCQIFNMCANNQILERKWKKNGSRMELLSCSDWLTESEPFTSSFLFWLFFLSEWN